jgi:hypothetical protein
VYSWSAIIDPDDRIVGTGDCPHYTGDVIAGLAFGNFVGNGSTALMRKHLVETQGGYDPGLRAQHAQGCEDWKLFTGLANVSHFAVVADHLTGYRHAPTAMSGDVLQMLRSDKLVRDEIVRRRPEHRLIAEAGRREYIGWLLRREIDSGHWDNARRLLPEFTGATPSLVGRTRRGGRLVARLARNRIKPRVPAPHNRPAFLPDLVTEEDSF